MFASHKFIGKKPIFINIPIVVIAKPISNKKGEGISFACAKSRSNSIAFSPKIGFALAYIRMIPNKMSETAIAPTSI